MTGEVLAAERTCISAPSSRTNPKVTGVLSNLGL